MNILLLDVWGKISRFIAGIFAIIPKLMYFLLSCILSLIDLCQIGFRKIAGLDPIIVSSETMQTEKFQGDYVYKLIVDALFTDKYPAIKTTFWSLMILAFFMLVVTSLIAILRVEWAPNDKTGNSKSGILKQFVKAIFSFAVIPISCLVGMYLCNALVGAIDSATAYTPTAYTEVSSVYGKWSTAKNTNSGSFIFGSSTLLERQDSYMAYEVFGVYIPTTNEPFSGIVFRACAYGANRMRNSEEYFKLLKEDNSLGIIGSYNDKEKAAAIIDTGFAINAKLKTSQTLNTSITDDFYVDCTDWVNLGAWSYKNLECLSKYNANAVFYFYDLWTFNYIVAFVAAIVIGKMYFNFVLFLMQRLFEILGLFVISPISVSLMPLDGGASLKKWRETYVVKFGTLVIMVLALNLVTPLLSICQRIQFFGIAVLDYLFLTFFLIAGLTAVNSLVSTFSEILLGKAFDADKTASAITGNFTSGVRATAGLAGMAGKVATAPASLAVRGGKAWYNAPAASASKNLEREKQEVAKAVHFGHEDGSEFKEKEINNKWKDMLPNERYNNADEFLETDQGKEFISKYYGGNETNAKNALLGVNGADVTETGARAAYEKYLFDKHNFAKSKEAETLVKNGASYEDYAKARQKYLSSSDEQKAGYFVGSSAPITDRQRQIQTKIKQAQKWQDSWGRKATKSVGEEMGNAKKRVAGVVSPVLKAGKTSMDRYSTPLKEVTNPLPFKGLFGNMKDIISATGYGPKGDDKK